MPTIEELRQTYIKFSNSRLETLSSEKEQLSIEAQQVLEEEMSKRINEQNVVFSFDENVQQTKKIKAVRQKIFVSRVGARIIDGVILYLACLILAQFFQGTFFDLDIFEAAKNVGVLIYFLLYYPIFESKGGTFGKRFLNLRTTDIKNQGDISLFSSYFRSFIQCWGLVISVATFLFLPFLVYTAMGAFIIFIFCSIVIPLTSYFDKNGQGLHDIWTQTLVLEKEGLEVE